MIAIRDIITEALSRANIVPRRQAAPGAMVETAFRALKGIISRYNNDNLLAFTQNTYTFSPNKHSIIHIYDTDKAYEDETALEINLKNVAKIQDVYIRYKDSTDDSFVKMMFTPFNSFDSYSSNDIVYSVIEKAENEFVLRIKDIVAKMNIELKIIYNEGLEFELNDDIAIPEIYQELLIVGLTHRLALMYPRLDATQMTRLENDLAAVQLNVKSPKAEMRMVTREPNDRDYATYGSILAGRFLGI